jgi:2-polyprenyl-3-methyl-5-hydroxy-6-metoxy-1,4-benzoquinol methylase
MRAMTEDPSSGYDAVAEAFIEARAGTGRALIKEWAASLPKGAAVLDVGAGHGEPMTRVLVEQGLDIFAIDASPKLAAAFRARFPGVPIACEAAEKSNLFGRRFDAIAMVGLIFLLPENTQRTLLTKLAAALEPKGRLLFSAPAEETRWTDVLTGRPSSSLGEAEYGRILRAAGLSVASRGKDEGGNHYHEAVRR